MSTNCLVTKLKESINDDTLLKCGELRLYINTESLAQDYKRARLGSVNAAQEIVAVGGNFVDSEGTSIGNTLTVPKNNNVYVYTDANVRYISIPNKYNIGSIWLYNCFVYLEQLEKVPLTYLQVAHTSSKVIGRIRDIKKFGKSTAALYMDAYRKANLKGKLEDLKGSTEYQSLSTLIIQQVSSVSGDIATLSELSFSGSVVVNFYGCSNITGLIDNVNCKDLTQLRLDGTNVGGTLEGFANAVYASGTGKVSGTIVLTPSHLMTYNGESISGPKTITFSAGGWSVS